MEKYRLKRGADGRERVEVRLRGPQLLNHPMYNHSTAFTREERKALGLEGLLPDVVSTLEQQVKRSYENVIRRTDPLDRYVVLTALQDRNEHLFFRLLVDHLEELLPIVYTPTVGQACQHFSRIFRRSRGLWITPEHRGRISEVLTHAPFEDARLVVVTDNEHILGLGDQGAGGMALPLGKLALSVAAAGIHPTQTLAISLDVGTDNRELLEDELYIGWPHPRLRGADYEAVVDELVSAVKVRFPRALLQWEDLEPRNAGVLLARYRQQIPSFNDDIQGAASAVVAGLLTAGREAGRPPAAERVVVAAAGPVGLGIARVLRATLRRAGAAGEVLQRAVALIDPGGLVVEPPGDVDLAWTAELAGVLGLGKGAPTAAVVEALRPTALVDASGLLGEEVVRSASRQVERPAVLLLGGPNGGDGALLDERRTWTGESGLVLAIAPTFVSPGISLGAVVSEAREVTDDMLAAAAEALAGQVTRDGQATVLPPVGRLRAVSARVAEAVAAQALREDLARSPLKDPAAAVAAAMWDPAYPVVEVS